MKHPHLTTGSEAARFRAFVNSTSDAERSWSAFVEFEDTIKGAALAAAMMNQYDKQPGCAEEQALLERVVAEMFYRVIERVDLGAVMANAEGIGLAIRYGVVAAKPDALDGVADTAAFETLAEQGFAAEQHNSDDRLRAAETEQDPLS